MIRHIETSKDFYEGILNAAKELFIHFGFKKTSVDDVAQKARVAKGTIYNYFKSKEDLFQKVLREEGVKLVARIREALKVQATPQQKIRELIIVKVKYYREFCLLHEISRQKAEVLLPFLEKQRDEIARQEMNIIKEILEEGVEALIFQVKNIPAAARALTVAIKGLEFGWSMEMNLDEATEEIDDLLQILFHGLESRS